MATPSFSIRCVMEAGALEEVEAFFFGVTGPAICALALAQSARLQTTTRAREYALEVQASFNFIKLLIRIVKLPLVSRLKFVSVDIKVIWG
jgi:hypothetical protein